MIADNLDLNKPVQTRDGRTVKIDRTDLKNDMPIAGTVTNKDGREFVIQWYSSGRRYMTCESASDLINVPPKPVKYYTHVYGHPDTRPGNHLTHTTTCKEPSPMTLPLIKTIEFEV